MAQEARLPRADRLVILVLALVRQQPFFELARLGDIVLWDVVPWDVGFWCCPVRLLGPRFHESGEQLALELVSRSPLPVRLVRQDDPRAVLLFAQVAGELLQ
jgi:hypothetical protein